MKKLLLSLLFVFCTLSAYTQANLREYVAIVRPIYTPSTVKFLNDFSRTMDGYGYKESAKMLKDYAKEGFGSGFLYVEPSNGKKFIITNRHVVSQANKVTVEFSMRGQDIVSYKDCEIVFVDEYLDLALIALPSDFPKNEGLNIEDETPADASDIYTAGFPGLGKEPSWQIGKGIVSNNSVYNKGLTGSKQVGAIQHTAPIDGGSSGGPLLMRNPDSLTGYDVVGINTWKAAGRESANFAISAKSIKTFINDYLNITGARDNEAYLQSQANEFTQAITKGYEEILPFISADYVSNLSVTGFQDLYVSTSDSTRKTVMQYFVDGRPIDGVRVALAEAIYTRYNKEKTKLTLSSVGTIDRTKDQPTSEVTFLRNGKETPLVWIFEQGDWRVKHLTSLKTNDLDEQGISTMYGYPNSFRLGVELPMGSDWEEMRYVAAFNRTYRTFMIYGIRFGMGKLKNMERSDYSKPIENNVVSTEKFSKSYFFTDVELGGQLPVKVSSVYLIPNAKGFLGMNFGEETGGSSYGFSLGLQAAKKLGGTTYLVGGVEFRRRFTLSQDYSHPDIDEYKFPPLNLLGIHIGITW